MSLLTALVALQLAATPAPYAPHAPQAASGARPTPRQVLVPQSRGLRADPARAAVHVAHVEADVVLDAPFATTTLRLRVENGAATAGEAELMVPIPDGATVTDFTFSGPDAIPSFEVLAKDDAKAVYRRIVSDLRDPAYLEFADYGALRTGVFPVPAGAATTITIEYGQVLGTERGRFDYVLPRSAMDTALPTTIRVEVRGEDRVLYSPTHPVERGGTGARYTVPTDGQGRIQPGDFRVSLLGNTDGPLVSTLYTTADPDGDGGWFLFLNAGRKGADANREIPLREVTLVLDRSGSMAGEKFEQAREAARQILEGLRPGESVQIIDYAQEVARFAPAPVVKSDDTIAALRAYLAGLGTGGGTNLDGALQAALTQPPTADRLPLVLFLTDGLPTEGEKREDQIRERARAANVHGRRVFTFGVGNDVNAPLLDAVATASRARATYVRPGADVEAEVGRVAESLAGPLVTDLAFEVRDAKGDPTTRVVRDVHPRVLPDLYAGDQLLVVGRYLGTPDEVTFRVTGTAGSAQPVWRARTTLDHGSVQHDFVRRLWAMRQVAALEDDLRSQGADPARLASFEDDPRFAETVAEILRLATRHGVLSDSTAFLAKSGSIGLGSEALVATACDWNTSNNTARSGAHGVAQQLNIQANRDQGWVTCNPLVQADGSTLDARNVCQAGSRTYFTDARGQWIEGARVLEDEAPEADRTVVVGTAAYAELLDLLDAEGRLVEASLPGFLIVHVGGEDVLVKTHEDTYVDPAAQYESPNAAEIETAPASAPAPAPAPVPAPGAVVIQRTRTW